LSRDDKPSAQCSDGTVFGDTNPARIVIMVRMGPPERLVEALKERAGSALHRDRHGSTAWSRRETTLGGRPPVHRMGTLCADRVAVAAAIQSGARLLDAVAVASATSPHTPPRGMRLKTLVEFASPVMPVVLTGARGPAEDHPGRVPAAEVLAESAVTVFSQERPPSSDRAYTSPQASLSGRACRISEIRPAPTHSGEAKVIDSPSE
jgi:hypothetical protein